MAVNSARGGSLTAQANGTRLKELRGDLKQREVEERCDIPRGYLTIIESGKLGSIKHIIKLANYYHVAPKELLTDEGLLTVDALLVDLAVVRGVRVDYSGNGDSKEHSEFDEQHIEATR